MNIVEIIIKAITRDAERNIKKTETALERLSKTGKRVGQSIKTMAATIGIATGILYLMERGIEEVANRAKDLGDNRTVRSIQNLKDALQQLFDQIITTNIGGAGTILDALNQGAQNLIPVVRAVGVVVEMASGGFRDMVLTIQRLQGVMAEAMGQTTEYTKAWFDAAYAQNHAATNARIGAIWEGKLTNEIEKQNNALYRRDKAAKGSTNSIKLQTAAVSGFTKSLVSLNQIMERQNQLEDARRAGDARAVAGLLNGGGQSGLASALGLAGSRVNPGARGGNSGVGSMASGLSDGEKVTIVVEGKPLTGTVKKIIRDNMLKPTGGGKKK